MGMFKRSEWLVSKTEVSSRHGIVATMYPQASEAGIEVLRQGGNAVDAAVAAGFAIGVVEPFNSGLGGIAVMVYHEAATGKTYIIDGAGTLPAATRQDQFRISPSGRTAGIYSWPEVENDANQTGYMSAAVQGMPACLCEALERWGTRPLAEVMAPAIHYADEGYMLDWYVALSFAVNQERMSPYPSRCGRSSATANIAIAPPCSVQRPTCSVSRIWLARSATSPRAARMRSTGAARRN